MLVFVIIIIILTIPRLVGQLTFRVRPLGGSCPDLGRADGAQVEHAARGVVSQKVSAVGGGGR